MRCYTDRDPEIDDLNKGGLVYADPPGLVDDV